MCVGCWCGVGLFTDFCSVFLLVWVGGLFCCCCCSSSSFCFLYIVFYFWRGR